MTPKAHDPLIDLVAAIDVGSNALRMQIFGRNRRGEIRVLATLRRPIRLGKDVFHKGRILEPSFHDGLEALKEFRRAIDEKGIQRIAAVATSAVREAANGGTFVEQAGREARIPLQIIDGSEEARLIITSFLERLPLHDKTAMHVEVGGGSVEVSIIKNGGIQFTITQKLGAVRLLELLNLPVEGDQTFSGILEDYLTSTHKRLRAALGGKKIDRFVVTGGNIESLVWLIEHQSWGTIQHRDGVPVISRTQLRKAIHRISGYSFRERVDLLGLRPDRADVILPAGLVYASFAEMAGAVWCHAPGGGVREGLAIELFRAAEEPHQRQKQRHLRSAIRALGEKYQNDERHAENVTEYATRIFDALRSVHGLGEAARTLLSAAGLLHDIGYYVEPSRHHKHSYYLISESDIVGLSPRDRLLVANVARYHRKAHPSEDHHHFAVLSQQEKVLVRQLSAILRVADALDREHASQQGKLVIRRQKTRLYLKLSSAQSLQLNRWAMNAKAELLHEVFGLEVVVI